MNPFKYLLELWSVFLYVVRPYECIECDGFGTPEGSIQGEPKCKYCKGTGLNKLGKLVYRKPK